MKKIMIFDDDQDILSICGYVLEEKGWNVTTYTDCRNIVAKVASILPDVIFMDNWIPDNDGIVATRQIESSVLIKHIPVIYFSANSNIAILASEAGADDYLAKPFDLDDFISKTIEVMQKSGACPEK